jgi:propionyl-CoA synthetase
MSAHAADVRASVGDRRRQIGTSRSSCSGPYASHWCRSSGADELKGQVPVGLLVLKADVHRPEEHIVREAVHLVRDRIGPVASFKTAVIVGRLPKTRSGKILRGTMRRIADDHQYSVPPTIDDPKILEEITEALHRVGYGRAFANVEPSS